MSLANDIKQKALELGFDAAGITGAAPVETAQVESLQQWLKAGCAGQMEYMHRNFEKRINPAKLLHGAQSVIVLALNYKPPAEKAAAAKQTSPAGKLARYALYEDYHSFIKKRLRRLAEFISAAAGGAARFKMCVDSAPVAERALAVRAGLGFIGRNHMLISPTLGPEIFLAEIITTLKLQPDKPAGGSCADCSRCIDACPTGALRPDGRFDATRCISYLTIEHKDRIPTELAEKSADRLFGCDECVLTCPHQDKAPVCKNTALRFHPDRAELDLKEVLALTDETFKARFADSPIARTRLDRIKRNARICMANAVL